MALSLNKIVSILADRVGQPFNINLQNELKDIIIYKREDYTRQFLDNNPQERTLFVQPFLVEMEKIETIECDVELSCEWFRSKCELPPPIRSKFAVWDFVGAADFSDSYAFSNPEFMQFHTFSKYTPKRPKWFWQGSRIIVMNEESMKYVGVRGIPEDPRLLNSCACATDGSQTCFDDDSPLPMAGDILNAIIRDTLNVELRNMFPQPGVIHIDKVEDAVLTGGE